MCCCRAGDADAYGTIADCYTDLDEFEKAAAYYDKYIQVGPSVAAQHGYNPASQSRLDEGDRYKVHTSGSV